jgi:flagellar biosynthesis protein FlhB
MSDEADKESKTEAPTEKRLQDAAEKGNDPVSREAPLFASLLALLAITGLLAKPAAMSLLNTMQQMMDSFGELRISGGADAQALMADVGLKLGSAMAPLLLVIMAFGLTSHFAQSLPRFVTSRIMPDFSRISIGAGFSRMFSIKGLVQFGKQMLQLSIVGFALTLVLQSEQGRILNLIFSRAVAIPSELLSLMFRLTATVAAASALVVVGDIVWTRMQWLRDLRMTKQEIKDEAKQSEGDPMVKARLRSIALDRARKRMMAQVPRATMVIANPTHYAIAIRYVREEGGAPIVVAKGQDLIALKIREIAEKAGVPVLEQKLLARSMYDLVEVDQAIPPEFYRAVAELIHFLSRKNPGLLPAR